MRIEQQQAVVAEAQRWLRTPYHHMAAVQGAGVDCLMLLACVFFNAGVVPWIDPRPYPTDWMLHRNDELYLFGLERYATDVSDQPPEPGDIQMFRYGRTYSHAAIVTRWPGIVHAFIGAGMVTLGRVDEAQFEGRVGPRYRIDGGCP